MSLKLTRSLGTRQRSGRRPPSAAAVAPATPRSLTLALCRNTLGHRGSSQRKSQFQVAPPMAVGTLQQLAALRTAFDDRLAGAIRMSGASVVRSRELTMRFVALRERARSEYPELFGDLPRRTWSMSIASQADDLRDARLDLNHLLAVAVQAGLLSARPETRGPLASPTAGAAPWIRDHIAQIVGALIVAYLVYQLGWN